MARKAEEVGVAKAGMSAATTFALAVLAGAFIAHGRDLRDHRHCRRRRAALRRLAPARRARILARPDPRRRRGRGALHRQQPDRDGVGGPEASRPRACSATGRSCTPGTSSARSRRPGSSSSASSTIRQGCSGGAGAVDRDREDRPRLRAGDRARRALQRARVPGHLAQLQRAHDADKILAIVPPIAAFVAAGFEHSVANMFFIPMGCS